MTDEHPIVERVRIECTDCGGLIDADMAIRRDDKPYCGECQERPFVEIVPRPDWLWEMPRSMLPGTPEARRKITDYIIYLEGQVSFDQARNMELHEAQALNRTLLDECHQAKAIIEGLTAERDRAEAALKNVR